MCRWRCRQSMESKDSHVSGWCMKRKCSGKVLEAKTVKTTEGKDFRGTDDWNRMFSALALQQRIRSLRQADANAGSRAVSGNDEHFPPPPPSPLLLNSSQEPSHVRVCLCFPRSICTASGAYSPFVVSEHELKL